MEESRNCRRRTVLLNQVQLELMMYYPGISEQRLLGE